MNFQGRRRDPDRLWVRNTFDLGYCHPSMTDIYISSLSNLVLRIVKYTFTMSFSNPLIIATVSESVLRIFVSRGPAASPSPVEQNWGS